MLRKGRDARLTASSDRWAWFLEGLLFWLGGRRGEDGCTASWNLGLLCLQKYWNRFFGCFQKSNCTVQKPVSAGGVLTPPNVSFWVICCYAVYLLPGLASGSCSSPCCWQQTGPRPMPPLRMRCCVLRLRSCLSACLQFRETWQHCSFLALGKPFPCHAATWDVSFQQQGASPCSWGASTCLYGK